MITNEKRPRVKIEEKTKRQLIKELALAGKTVEEIMKELNLSRTYVDTTFTKLRSKKDFNVSSGHNVSKDRQEVIGVFHKFNMIHGFFPSNSWVARKLGVSREWTRVVRPTKDEEKDKFVRTKEAFFFPKEFVEFLQAYSDTFEITRVEAMKSFFHNMDLDFKSLTEKLLEKDSEDNDGL